MQENIYTLMQKYINAYVEKYKHLCRKIYTLMQKNINTYVEKNKHLCRKK